MFIWRMAIVSLFYCYIKMTITCCQTKVGGHVLLLANKNRRLMARDICVERQGSWVILQYVPVMFLDNVCQTACLFTAVRRSKRGGATTANPTFYNSFSDVHLLFEILLTGITFEPSGEVSVQDAELASLRKTQNLKVVCEERVPRKPSDILMFVSHLSNQTEQLSQDDFECTLLTLVYLAQQMVNSITNYQRDMWAESFVSLYEAIKQDLMR